MTQDEYTTFTGETVKLDDEIWERIVAVAKNRLASFLCLETFPETDEAKLLLAEFLALFFKLRGTPDLVSSKSVRNFTISFNNSATDLFTQLAKNYGDLIERLSECGMGVRVERSPRRCCR